LILFAFIAACTLPATAQQYFSAPHSSLDEKQVIKAVLRHELAHRELANKKGVVFVRIFGRDPSQELVNALSDLPIRILPASRAWHGQSRAGVDVPAVLTYRDELSGKEGPLFDIRRLEWVSEDYVRMIGGYSMTSGWGGEQPGPGAIIITLDHSQWRVR
jgi:hypothetical protein